MKGPQIVKPSTVGLRGCRPTPRKLRAFLRAHGDDLPPAELLKATRKMPEWVTWCDQKGLAAVVRVAQNDWFLCTLKNAAVRPDLRGRGIASKQYSTAAARALANRSKFCKVLAADVTYDNVPSIKAAERAGFKRINRFCWSKGEKPAGIYHFVLSPPSRDNVCRRVRG